MHERELLTATLTRSVTLAGETKHLEFALDGANRFDFTAGQFISIKSAENGRELTRAYSLASAPRANNTFDLCLNRVEEGVVSNMLCDLEPGAQIRFHGPHGYFTLRQPVRDSLLIATGTGIAPIRGMLEWLFADEVRHADHEYWLIYGTRFESDIYYREEFEQMQRQHPNFHYIVTISRPGESWTGLRGYVQDHVAQIAHCRTDLDAYICGLADMVKANRTLLLNHGLDRKAIVYERFD